MKSQTKPKFLHLVIAGVLASSVAIATGGVAQAAEIPTEPVSLSASVQEHNSPEVSVLESNKIVVGNGETTSSIELPGEAVATNQLDVSDVPDELFAGKGTPLVSTVMADASLTSYETETGTQTLISIDSASASNEYRFPLSLPSGAMAKVESDGSVSVNAQDGGLIGKYLSPWAVDGNGTKVGTSFSLQGNTLIQTVNFDATTAFPVIADPQWWQTALSITAGAATGAAVAAAVAGVSTGVGVIIGGCVTGALNSMWDGSDFWGGFRGCLLGAALGAVGRVATSVVRNTLKAYGIGV